VDECKPLLHGRVCRCVPTPDGRAAEVDPRFIPDWPQIDPKLNQVDPRLAPG